MAACNSFSNMRILICDPDFEQAETLATFFSWYSIEADTLGQISEVRAALDKGGYEIFIGGLIEDEDGMLRLVGQLREDGFEGPILLYGVQELPVRIIDRLRLFNAYFLSTFEAPVNWVDRVETLLAMDEGRELV